LAMSLCDSEFSVVTQPASASTSPSAANRARPNSPFNESPHSDCYVNRARR
jgi:hypothetical protein